MINIIVKDMDSDNAIFTMVAEVIPRIGDSLGATVDGMPIMYLVKDVAFQITHQLYSTPRVITSVYLYVCPRPAP